VNPVLIIVIYAFIFVVILIFAIDWDGGDGGAEKNERLKASAPTRHHPPFEDPAEVQSLDHWSGDSGSRIGDHVITSQSDLADFDSFSDSWRDSWGGDD
jgi:hypothetical protein